MAVASRRYLPRPSASPTTPSSGQSASTRPTNRPLDVGDDHLRDPLRQAPSAMTQARRDSSHDSRRPSPNRRMRSAAAMPGQRRWCRRMSQELRSGDEPASRAASSTARASPGAARACSRRRCEPARGSGCPPSMTICVGGVCGRGGSAASRRPRRSAVVEHGHGGAFEGLGGMGQPEEGGGARVAHDGVRGRAHRGSCQGEVPLPGCGDPRRRRRHRHLQPTRVSSTAWRAALSTARLDPGGECLGADEGLRKVGEAASATVAPRDAPRWRRPSSLWTITTGQATLWTARALDLLRIHAP